MKKRTRLTPEKTVKIIYIAVMLSFIAPILFIIYRLATIDDITVTGRTSADYVLMLVQCILGMIVIHIPSVLDKRFKLDLPKVMYILYMLFLYCAIFLGEVRSFFYTIPHWDDLLHGSSSIMTGLLGFMLVSILNKNEHVNIRLSPAFVALFAFCFALTIGTLWELYEYTFDGLLGLNMQKFRLEDGTELIGHHALTDTMKDFAVDGCGAFVSALIGYISLKDHKGFIHDYYVRHSKNARKADEGKS